MKFFLLLVKSWIKFPPTPVKWTIFMSSVRHHVPMQHVLLGPKWPTRWYVSDLLGTSNLDAAADSPETLTHSWGYCVAGSLASLLPAPPAAGKGTGACDYDLLPHLGPQLQVFPLLPWLLIVFPICLLWRRLLSVQDGKDIRETKHSMLFCYESRH